MTIATPTHRNGQLTKLNLDGVPAALKARPQWVLWKAIVRDGQPTKIPFGIDGKPAKANVASTWATYQQVVDKFQAGGYSGIGFVFSADDSFCGIDLDGCRNPETSELAACPEPLN